MNADRKVHNSKYTARIFNVPCSNPGPETNCLAHVPPKFLQKWSSCALFGYDHIFASITIHY